LAAGYTNIHCGTATSGPVNELAMIVLRMIVLQSGGDPWAWATWSVLSGQPGPPAFHQNGRQAATSNERPETGKYADWKL
jgi:hypothetical protein